MKTILTLITLLALPLSAQEPSTLLEKLFTTREPAQFQKTLTEAKAAGISKQALLEARFLYFVDNKDLKSIAKLSKEFSLQAKTFNPEESKIFALEEDWLAVVEYTKAIQALLKDEPANFEKHIKEAFWLSPRQAAAFAPHIEKLRLDQAMENLVIPNNTPIQNLITNKTQTLETLRSENKATLIHFWSPWSRESAESFADFLATAEACEKNKINVISILIDDPAAAKNDALEFIKENAPDAKSYWAIDQKKSSLTRTLRVNDMPTFALISNQGKVLFNGHPSDQQFWSELKKINPKLTRPTPEPTQP